MLGHHSLPLISVMNVWQDLLVASLFRNFLLAERIMRAVSCTPVSLPRLPPSHQHHMWHAWDMAAELCLLQLPGYGPLPLSLSRSLQSCCVSDDACEACLNSRTFLHVPTLCNETAVPLVSSKSWEDFRLNLQICPPLRVCWSMTK